MVSQEQRRLGSMHWQQISNHKSYVHWESPERLGQCEGDWLGIR